ncbi:hypothetical protein Q5Y75_11605 [Ruegeria sp. 2205SS24-7]|uniref:hypothetical protein n=1 Tax=Ruegeria discodermiae TaxID=3064389 RepID=UPI0027415E89|nr:hypothetical protein [Ruegeria sp. 2205SS24-7]MDP5217865.1 hypothetical protein [Ruegeria sp. 2205SS24-7]
MDIEKHLKTFLCNNVAEAGGGKLRSSYAHEIVAAFLGYGRKQDLVADLKTQTGSDLELLRQASHLLVDADLVDRRCLDIEQASLSDKHGSIVKLPSPEQVIVRLRAILEYWRERPISLILIYDDGRQWIEQVHDNLLFELTESLSGVMADTNAFFGEMTVDTGGVWWGESTVELTCEGMLHGEQDRDRMYLGDKIDFQATLKFTRSGGRTGVKDASFTAFGAVDHSVYY